MRYKATIVGNFIVECENIVEARKLANKLKIIKGNIIGSKRLTHNRDSIRYSVKELKEPLISVVKL